MKKLNKKAFTLVELIIVIAIIAILAVSAGLMLTKWIGKSKDARTLADLGTIKKALDIGYVENMSYPMPDDSKEIKGESGEVLWYQGRLGVSAVSKISVLTKVPEDTSKENPEEGYDYSLSADQNTYEVYGKLSNSNMISYNPYIEKTYASNKSYYITSVGNYNGQIVGETGDKYIIYKTPSMYLLGGTELKEGSQKVYKKGDKVGAEHSVKDVDISGLYDEDNSNDEEVLSGVVNKFGLGNNEMAKTIVNQAANAKGVVKGGGTIKENTLNKCDIFGDGSAVALYTLDGDANDKCGNYNGTGNNVTYDTGKFGQAAVFNGSDGYIDTAYKTSNSNNTYSISAWVKRNSTNTQDAIYTEVDLTNNSYGTYLSFKNDGKKILGGHFKRVDSDFDNVGGDISSYVSSMTDWIHIVFTRENGNEHKLYINGSLFNTVSCANVTNDSSFAGEIGANTHYTGGNRYFDGLIDQVRIFNRALTDDEVKTLYEEGR